MNKAIITFLTLSLFIAIPVSRFKPNTSSNHQASVSSMTQISDSESDDLIGEGDKARKFGYGVACGLGSVAIVVGFAGGVFTGGASAAVTAFTIVGGTVAACGEAFS